MKYISQQLTNNLTITQFFKTIRNNWLASIYPKHPFHSLPKKDEKAEKLDENFINIDNKTKRNTFED